LRRRDHDYTGPAIYLVTVCSHQRAHLFANSIGGIVQLSPAGRIVSDRWNAIPQHFDAVSVDEYTVMPDHIHGIIIVREQVGARHASPLRVVTRPTLRSASLGAIIGSFKSSVTKAVNELRHTPGAAVWQRNYYEQIVMNLEAAREYVRNNRPTHT
jgi:putative transposase